MFEALLRRGTLLLVVTIIICIFGVLATLRVPVQMIPDLEVRTISVRTSWPGATPQDVEKEILVEQEQYLRGIPNLRRMVSSASTGSASIELEFPFGTDINDALVRVNNALSQVPAYPENVDEPRLLTSSFSYNPFLNFRVLPVEGNPRGLDMYAMRDFLDNHVRTRMERVEGVSQVNLGGGAERQVQILVDAAALAKRGLSLPAVRDAIRARNRDVSGGDLDSGKRRYLLRTVGRFDTVADLEGLILVREGDNITRLGDVAEVRMGQAELRALSYFNGTPVMSLWVVRETGANVIAVRAAVVAEVERIKREVLEPAGMTMALSNDDVVYVEDSVANVWRNLGLGAVLAAGVMFFFLRSVPLTLVGLAGVPVCTIAAFLGLLLAGRTINVISLAGVAFAIGMTLDNTIVVLEAIEQERRRGLARFEAALAGVKRVWTAVLASTMTTVLVFVPVLFVEQEAGQIYSDIAIAIGAAIILSMFVAVTLVPAATARLKFAPAATLPGTAGKADDDHAPAPGKARIMAGVRVLLATGRRRAVVVGGTVVLTVAALIGLTPPKCW
jgi:multidrug efflux pump subunit AcrB